MPTESFGQAFRVVRERYAADIDAYRDRWGKAEGERRFFAEHAPEAEAPAPAPALPDPFASVSIDVGPGRR